MDIGGGGYKMAKNRWKSFVHDPERKPFAPDFKNFLLINLPLNPQLESKALSYPSISICTLKFLVPVSFVEFLQGKGAA